MPPIAAFLALDCARQRLGLVAVDPPEQGDSTMPYKRTTIKTLSSALQNAESTLID